MKKAKILLSVLLALTMILALGATAFAADGTLTVADPGTATYKAYKIFDATVDTATNEVTFTLDAASEWVPVLLQTHDESGTLVVDTNTDGTPISLFPGLSYKALASGSYEVVKGNTFKAADFAEFLRGASDANLAGKTAVDLAGDPPSASLSAGYYLVISNDGTTNQEKAMLTRVLDDTNVKIQNKNDMPFDKEVDNEKEKSVEVGDTVNFKLTSKVPSDIATYTSYIFLVSDKMDAGLTSKDDVAVTIGGTPVTLTTVTDPSAILTGNQIRYNANNKTFELSLDMVGQTADAAIEITYSAVVNENAAGHVSENNAVLEYGNDPDNLTIKDSQTKVYTSKLIIDKYETGAPEQKLSGAKFVLKNAAGEYYYQNPTTKAVSWVDEADLVDSSNAAVTVSSAEDLLDAANITIVETDSDGAASFAGLEDGDYELIEIKAPAGYTRIENPIPVTIDGSASTAVGLSQDQIVQALTNVANVANTPGTNLPSTGGIGTTIFTVVGGLLIAGAIIFVIIRKRGEAEA